MFTLSSRLGIEASWSWELWAAKDDVDGQMKADLAQVIEWNAITIRDRTNTRNGGRRYLERWADPLIVERLAGTFAEYEAAAIARALIAIQLVKDVASETAAALGFSYPEQSHAAVYGWAIETPLRRPMTWERQTNSLVPPVSEHQNVAGSCPPEGDLVFACIALVGEAGNLRPSHQ